MRIPKVIALIVATVMVTSLACCQSKWQTVSIVRHDWNHRGRLVTLIFQANQEGDPGDFHRVRIQVPGHPELVVTNDTGWVKWRAEGDSLPAKLLSSKEDAKSDYALFLKVSPGRSMLVLIGYPYASSPGSLHVVELTDSDEPKLILHKEELGLSGVDDLDADGTKEIVTYPCLSEGWGHDFLTYDPLNVYKLPSKAGVGQAALSVELSRTYNLKHYYGWAGVECSQDVAIVLHPPGGGKPVIMKAKDAERLFPSEK